MEMMLPGSTEIVCLNKKELISQLLIMGKKKTDFIRINIKGKKYWLKIIKDFTYRINGEIVYSQSPGNKPIVFKLGSLFNDTEANMLLTTLNEVNTYLRDSPKLHEIDPELTYERYINHCRNKTISTKSNPFPFFLEGEEITVEEIIYKLLFNLIKKDIGEFVVKSKNNGYPFTALCRVRFNEASEYYYIDIFSSLDNVEYPTNSNMSTPTYRTMNKLDDVLDIANREFNDGGLKEVEEYLKGVVDYKDSKFRTLVSDLYTKIENGFNRSNSYE